MINWQFLISNCADTPLSHSLSIIVNNQQQNFKTLRRKTMKVKFMPMLASIVMFAVVIAPLSAVACSGDKNTSNSDSPTEPSNLPQT
jgi:1,4-dihydroxy-2-naphthoate octaprenyltransferase